jgi:dTMP kinase
MSDRFEAETVTFFEKVREGYLAIARGEPARVKVIDAAAPLEEVEHQVGLLLALLSISRALA